LHYAIHKQVHWQMVVTLLLVTLLPSLFMTESQKLPHLTGNRGRGTRCWC